MTAIPNIFLELQREGKNLSLSAENFHPELQSQRPGGWEAARVGASIGAGVAGREAPSEDTSPGACSRSCPTLLGGRPVVRLLRAVLRCAQNSPASCQHRVCGHTFLTPVRSTPSRKGAAAGGRAVPLSPPSGAALASERRC